VATQERLLRHREWRRTSLLRHCLWRRKNACFATVNGEAKRGYFFEIVWPMVYYLKSFQVWVIFV
jgi:hypothetical protein